VGITPDIPNDVFKSQRVANTIDPSTFNPRLDDSLTYAYTISGADLCNETTIVALEYCSWARLTHVGRVVRIFDFCTIIEPGPGVQDTSYCISAERRLVQTNCSDVLSTQNTVCCSYFELPPSSPAQSNVKYIAIANLRRSPPYLMRLPNNYTGTYYYRGGVTIPRIDTRGFDEREGNFPALRVYYGECI